MVFFFVYSYPSTTSPMLSHSHSHFQTRALDRREIQFHLSMSVGILLFKHDNWVHTRTRPRPVASRSPHLVTPKTYGPRIGVIIIYHPAIWWRGSISHVHGLLFSCAHSPLYHVVKPRPDDLRRQTNVWRSHAGSLPRHPHIPLPPSHTTPPLRPILPRHPHHSSFNYSSRLKLVLLLNILYYMIDILRSLGSFGFLQTSSPPYPI